MAPLSAADAAEASTHIKTSKDSNTRRSAWRDEEDEKGREFTVGTVFILVANQAAGERSLVEAVVTTSRALWHVGVPEELRGPRTARGGEGIGMEMEGLNQTLGEV